MSKSTKQNKLKDIVCLLPSKSASFSDSQRFVSDYWS